MTWSRIIVPFISFILARISSDENIRKNILMNICLNLISLFFTSICFYILYELQKKYNNKRIIIRKNKYLIIHNIILIGFTQNNLIFTFFSYFPLTHSHIYFSFLIN